MAGSARKKVVMPEEEIVTEAETEAVAESEAVAEDGAADDSEQDAHTRPEELRLLEALLFAAGEPVDEKSLAERMPQDADVKAALRKLQQEYAPRGVNLLH